MATQNVVPSLKRFFALLDENKFEVADFQRLIGNGDIIVALGKGKLDPDVVRKLLCESTAEVEKNPYANEKTEPKYFYPKGWHPKSMNTQLAVLSKEYSYLGGNSHVLSIADHLDVPSDADGLFVIPKLSVVADTLGINDPFGKGYGQLLEQAVLKKLGKSRKFDNWREGQLGPKQIKMLPSAVSALKNLEEVTLGDYLVIAAQTGKKYAGYSVRNALWKIEHSQKEFPLPAWVVGHILLTHPERIAKFENSAIDCPGDEYSPSGNAEFSCAVYFYFNNENLYFHSHWTGNVSYGFGSASGFYGSV
jgi:hypothetical protein